MHTSAITRQTLKTTLQLTTKLTVRLSRAYNVHHHNIIIIIIHNYLCHLPETATCSLTSAVSAEVPTMAEPVLFDDGAVQLTSRTADTWDSSRVGSDTKTRCVQALPITNIL